MDNLIKFVPEQLLIVVAALYIVGLMLKNTKQIKDWCIPWILLVCGIIGSIAIIGLSTEAIIYGILVTGVTVFGNQLFKQTIDKREE